MIYQEDIKKTEENLRAEWKQSEGTHACCPDNFIHGYAYSLLLRDERIRALEEQLLELNRRKRK